MKIYQDALGKWILWTGSEKLRFDTEMEAIEAMEKLELAKAIVMSTQAIIDVMDNGPDVLQEYFDSGVTFTDADVEPLGIVATDITACLTALENAGKFFSGDSPANAVYRVTVNQVRRVDAS